MTEKQFKQIVTDYEKLIFTVCHQLVGDYQEAQNLTQETFLTAYFHLDHCSSDKYRPYLARIAANKAKDFLKSAYRRRVTLFDEQQPEPEDASASPEQQHIRSETLEELNQKIHSLKEPYRTVSKLFFLQELTPGEIAVRLDRPPKTVQTQITRARKLLQDQIEEARYR